MTTAIFFEKVLIKFLFTNEKIRDRTVPFLKPEIFEDHKNLQIMKTAISMNEKFENFPSIPEMKLELSNEEVYNRLTEIMDMDISEYQSEFLIEEIEEFIRNKLIHNVNVEIAMNLNNSDADKLKQTPDLLREAISFSFDTKVGLDFLEEKDRLFDHLHNKDRVVKTSIDQFNTYIEGGFHEKSLTLFMAETNLGKSLIMASLAVDCILRNKNVLYVTCEMSENKISERMMANMFDISTDDLKLLTKSKFDEKFESLNKQVKKKMVVKEYPPRSVNTNHLRNLMKELKVRKKFVPDIIFIDYIGIMNPVHKNKGDNTYLEIKRISEEVRALAVEMSIPIVSAVQNNRGGFGDSEIDLTSISDSIGTAATADIIIGVTQSQEMRNAGKFTWLILKNRYGLNKRVMSVAVDYYKMRVYEDLESTTRDMAKSITKDPPHPKDFDNKIKNIIKETTKVINKDTTDKFNKTIEYE